MHKVFTHFSNWSPGSVYVDIVLRIQIRHWSFNDMGISVIDFIDKILKYLVESGADINCRDTIDQSVLDHAYKTCKPFATFLLFKYGGMIRRNCKETLLV
jgi:hypothetical protein